MIFVTDKDDEMRAVLQSQLRGIGPACEQAASAREILAQARSGKIHVWVTDSILPDGQLDEVVREVLTVSPSTQILVLIPNVDSEALRSELTRSIEAGVTDFLVKPFERSALIAKIRGLLRRSGQAMERDDSVLSLGDLTLRLSSGDVYRGGERVPLTPSEYKLLHALLLRQGSVLSRDQLIQLVQGSGIAVVDRAVDTHVASLRKKLGSASEWIETVRGVGYRISGRREPAA